MGAPYPATLPEVFASDADPSRRNVIPPTTANPQRASWSLGFPPQTMTPIIAGGKPMLGPDMNGTLYAMSSHTFYAQTGQPYRWNADVLVALGSGYAIGTLLGSTDGLTLWLCITNNNATDPDAGGAGWVPMFSYGMTLMPATTGGVVTLTAAQASKSVIVLSGALVANLQVNLPTSLRRWLIVNTTTGGFVTTVKTTGGAGVTVSQGGYAAPTEVFGDGVNIYNVVAPTSIPGDVAPTPNTFALRSNIGNLFATKFNQNSALENFPINEVYAGAGDGFLRKINTVNFAANFFLAWFAGQVNDSQVPLSAVDQYRATILDDSVLTGTPTAPTPAAGDNSSSVATTAFVSAAVSGVTDNESVTFPGGFTIKAGFAQGAAGIGDVAVAFSAPFANRCIAVIPMTANRNAAGAAGTGYPRSVSQFGFTALYDVQTVGPGVGLRGGYWIAVGV